MKTISYESSYDRSRHHSPAAVERRSRRKDDVLDESLHRSGSMPFEQPVERCRVPPQRGCRRSCTTGDEDLVHFTDSDDTDVIKITCMLAVLFFSSLC